jgi:hypothetical protein
VRVVSEIESSEKGSDSSPPETTEKRDCFGSLAAADPGEVSTTSSTKGFHAPHAGHFPSHFMLWFEQFVQIYTVLIPFMPFSAFLRQFPYLCLLYRKSLGKSRGNLRFLHLSVSDRAQ